MKIQEISTFRHIQASPSATNNQASDLFSILTLDVNTHSVAGNLDFQHFVYFTATT